jgi:pimeloyl-ACP methyl ester carboxylesterase
VYTSPEAAERLRAWYPRARARIRAATEVRAVPTRHGDAHVLVGGPPEAPPLVLLHGALASSAHVLAEVEPLLRSFRVYAPDLPGHSPVGADVRVPLDGYGPWVAEVIDGLGVGPVALCGVSYGGFVAIRAAVAAPERISRLVLIVPGGLAAGSAWDGVVKLAIPMALYRWFPSDARLDTFLRPQFTELDDFWRPWIGEAVRGFRLDFRVPPIATADELRGFRAPVLVLAADDDVHFPGPAVLRRAAEVFPNLAGAELIAGCKHTPPFDDGFRERLCDRIAGFLA